MGFLLGGPYYHLKGRTGNNVGRIVRGKNVFSMRPHRAERAFSEAELSVHMKLGLVTGWLSDVSSFLKLGFEREDKKMTAWNAAVKFNLDNAITGVYPNFTIDYPKVLFSKGKRAPLSDLAVATTEEAQLDFSWTATIDVLQPGAPDDEVVIIIYNPLKQKFVISPAGILRSALSYDMALPPAFSGDNVEVYASVLSADEKEVSTSVYLGSVEVM
ncbi:DUF6266 family protein [Pedobacter faecalis]|uniref:DUF6266 family protein n=1 Tax=Pedobacter faecalis TaxID=3041495 RepID=UPI00254CB1D1|nr:DUF6266 family protein [Pedobacter sp. ELA7]